MYLLAVGLWNAKDERLESDYLFVYAAEFISKWVRVNKFGI